MARNVALKIGLKLLFVFSEIGEPQVNGIEISPLKLYLKLMSYQLFFTDGTTIQSIFLHKLRLK